MSRQRLDGVVEDGHTVGAVAGFALGQGEPNEEALVALKIPGVEIGLKTDLGAVKAEKGMTDNVADKIAQYSKSSGMALISGDLPGFGAKDIAR